MRVRGKKNVLEGSVCTATSYGESSGATHLMRADEGVDLDIPDDSLKADSGV